MSAKLVKIEIERFSNAIPEICVWNNFDSEHPPYMHGKRKNGEGMEPSYILFENSHLNLSYDTFKFPIFSFLKYRSLMMHISTPDHSVYQFSSFFGVLTAQKYSATPMENGKTRFFVETIFYLTGIKKLMAPFLKRYATKWMEKTWEEDLCMKERRHKFLNHGFKDMKGLPERVSDRFQKVQELKLPLPRAKGEIDTHEFNFNNLNKLFNSKSAMNSFKT